MSLLPFILFTLGVIVLIVAWKMESSTNSKSPEIIALLKGLAGVKRELGQVQRGVREAEARMDDHELRILRNENAQAELQSMNQVRILEQTSERREIYDSLFEKNQATFDSGDVNNTLRALPEKYRWVLELHNQGWSIAEISGHLGISKDAVNMVLSTSQRGGHS